MAQPAWVYKRDGRLAPFDPDKISRALFAASRSLGRPDAFLARELSDGVLHFLAAEGDAGIPTTAHVAELVTKVVRELGQPGLAQAFSEGTGTAAPDAAADRAPPSVLTPAWFSDVVDDLVGAGADAAEIMRRAGEAVLREYSLRRVFAEDVAAAHAAGLVTLRGLEHPFQLAAAVARPGPDRSVGPMIRTAAERAGRTIAIDSLDDALADGREASPAAVAAAVADLRSAAAAVGAGVIVNLNAASPPPWATSLGAGPLFTPRAVGPARAGLADEIASVLLRGGPGAVEIHWHVSGADLSGPGAARTVALVRAALEGAPVSFTVDRPRQPVVLGDGLDREHSLLLLEVEIHLERLADHLGPGVAPAQFIDKLASVARLARAAGSQKREFLRRRVVPSAEGGPALESARARLGVVPAGVAEVVARFVPAGLASAPGLELAGQMLGRLRDVLEGEARHHLLEAIIDCSDFRGRLKDSLEGGARDTPDVESLAPVVAGAGGGTLVAESDPAAASPESGLSLLALAWRQRGLRRVRFSPPRPPRQLVAEWQR